MDDNISFATTETDLSVVPDTDCDLLIKSDQRRLDQVQAGGEVSSNSLKLKPINWL